MRRIVKRLIMSWAFICIFAFIFASILASCPVPGIDIVTPVADDFGISGVGIYTYIRRVS